MSSPPSYAELHAHSAYSFLDGCSQPAELVQRAAELGLSAIAITDHDGLYAAVQCATAARAAGIGAVYGAELTLGVEAETPGADDPPGTHLLVLARGPAGYARLSRAIARGYLVTGQKGPPRFGLEELAAAAGGEWLVLTGCRKGAVRCALEGSRPSGDGFYRPAPAWDFEAAQAELDRLVALFGRDNVAVEVTDSADPWDGPRGEALAELAVWAGLPLVATGNVHYARPRDFAVAGSMAALRGRRPLDQMDGFLPGAPTAHLRSAAQMLQRHMAHPEAVAAAAALARECAFDLRLIAPDLPPARVPPGHTEASYLRQLTWRGAAERYGPRGPDTAKAYGILEHELAIIEQMNFPGYFLTVYQIVQFCRQAGILCQGRGSAANSAVCYVLGITAVDAVKYGLLFERFLAPAREGYPDIDLDIESGRREEVIQHVYATYGRENCALVGAVISYRPRLALRDAAKALGYDTGQQDAWAKQVERWGSLTGGKIRYTPWGRGDATPVTAPDDLSGIPPDVLELAESFMKLPRHLGIHPGGMVVANRPVTDICPVQWGRMADRSVLQWDKDDAADAGLVKFDLLGLGMLGAVRLAFEEIERTEGQRWQMHTIPSERPEVYDLLCAADTVGVFQVESRAQMATLPRLQPRRFYDLVVEVALIRPGPIQGGSVHPYIERARGREPVTYDHPLLQKALERTLGVPLFQEQLMQMAIDAAGFTAGQADQLRRAMGSKRSPERMAALKEPLMAGMAARGIPPDARDRIFDKLRAFADFGFPESHSFSFALIVYVSAWLKVFHPAAFYAAILASQPMGFYSPQSLVADARRHGLGVLGPCVNNSQVEAVVQCLAAADPKARPWSPLFKGDPSLGVRLGLAAVRGIGQKMAKRIVAARDQDGPYQSLEDLAWRAELGAAQMEALATAGALSQLEPDRRRALWAAGAIGGPGLLPGTAVGVEAPALPGLSEAELAAADMWATGVSLGEYPTAHLRPQLDQAGVVPLAQVSQCEVGEWLKVAGVVTHRQRPNTAKGVTFVSLEDETGLLNVICTADVWQKYRKAGRTATALIVSGRLERQDGAVGLKAGHLHPLYLRVPAKSRDFQ
ncbi:MAG: error-prone DNA polymerase [Bifidobacteriaceae bacterium]|jgi:error-prone DNA polymerase|nr:error-prone DNA polymerase [Bifidobacteriaceae bacterium]